MPMTTPEIKVEAVRDLGAEVVLAGDNYSEAKAHCDELAVSTGRSLRAPVRRPAGHRGSGHDRQRDSAHKLGDVAASSSRSAAAD